MDHFFVVKKAVETFTVQDLIAAILYFQCADIFSGKRREAAYNQTQKTATFLQKWVLASKQRLLCRTAKRGSSDHCRILPYKLRAIQHISQPKLFAVLPRTLICCSMHIARIQAHFTAYLQAFKHNLLPENPSAQHSSNISSGNIVERCKHNLTRNLTCKHQLISTTPFANSRKRTNSCRSNPWCCWEKPPV